MNQNANNDIDILLRRLSRQNGNTLNEAQDVQQAEQKHLDADELNAYAENVLPSALRTRYTEHLSECTSCRKIVTQLSLASAAVVPRKVEEARPSALKTFLAGLFSPVVFRYAVPALAIVVVVAIAWVALQQERSASPEVAQSVNNQSAPPAPAVEIMKDGNSANTKQLEGQSSNRKETPSRVGEKSAQSRDAAPENKQEAIAEEKKLGAATDELRDREDLSKRNQPQQAAPVAAAPGAGGTATVTVPKSDDVAERREIAQKKESEADKNKVMSEPKFQSSTATAQRPPKEPATKAAPKPTPAATVQSGRALRREARAKDETSAGEVRTVGGHSFRKQGDVWVDSLYSSQPITNVSRGSEQYRALVADEPGIRSIAEQLNAELIIVWKSRAYRIR